MPCRCDPTPTETEELRSQLDNVTRIACWAMKTLDEHNREATCEIEYPNYVAGWWKKHQEADRKRKAEEQKERKRRELVRDARAKLTREELVALGLNP